MLYPLRYAPSGSTPSEQAMKNDTEIGASLEAFTKFFNPLQQKRQMNEPARLVQSVLFTLYNT